MINEMSRDLSRVVLDFYKLLEEHLNFFPLITYKIYILVNKNLNK